MPLKYLDLQGIYIKDIRPLAGLPLEYLDMRNTNITDISELKGMPLKELYLPPRAKDTEFLRNIKTLKKVNGKSIW